MEEQARSLKEDSAKVVPLNRNKFTLAENYLSDKYEFRVNTVALTIEYRELVDSDFEEVNENSLYRELQKMNICLSLTNLLTLLRSDFVPKYDPFEEYFKNLPVWDGCDHISRLASYVKVINQADWEVQFKKHLVRTVRCALDNNYFNKQTLILVGKEQNTGKSTFLRFLCPPALSNYIAENISVDKDSRILLAKNFLINLDELAMFSKQDINVLKSFMSKVQINERLPFDRKNSILPRRASFIGSTNNYDFLTDETGTVRWLCFELNRIEWGYSTEIDIDKVWSQSFYLYNSGFNLNLTKAEIAENEIRNKSFRRISMEMELILQHFDFDETRNPANWKNATMIMQDLIRLSGLTRINPVVLGKACTALNIPDGKKNDLKGYFLKEKSIVNLIQPAVLTGMKLYD